MDYLDYFIETFYPKLPQETHPEADIHKTLLKHAHDCYRKGEFSHVHAMFRRLACEPGMDPMKKAQLHMLVAITPGTQASEHIAYSRVAIEIFDQCETAEGEYEHFKGILAIMKKCLRIIEALDAKEV